MAQHMKAILGDMLLTQPLEGQDPSVLPSPEVRPSVVVSPCHQAALSSALRPAAAEGEGPGEGQEAAGAAA